MQYRELTTRVVQAGLGVLTFSEEPASDDADNSADNSADDSADDSATREHDDPSDGDDDGAAFRATLPTLAEVPDKRQRRQR